MLFALAIIAVAFTRSRSQPLLGWQKLFGAIGVVSVILILLQPELLALGLFGDTAFFDMLVLAMSLQMHMLVTRALRRGASVVARCVPREWIPSPGLSYLVAVSTLAILSGVSAFQKSVHRMLSDGP